MTPDDAAFINELHERATAGTADAGLLKQAADKLIGAETDQYAALVAEAAAQREAARADLTPAHQADLTAKAAHATKQRHAVHAQKTAPPPVAEPPTTHEPKHDDHKPKDHHRGSRGDR